MFLQSSICPFVFSCSQSLRLCSFDSTCVTKNRNWPLGLMHQKSCGRCIQALLFPQWEKCKTEMIFTWLTMLAWWTGLFKSREKLLFVIILKWLFLVFCLSEVLLPLNWIPDLLIKVFWSVYYCQITVSVGEWEVRLLVAPSHWHSLKDAEFLNPTSKRIPTLSFSLGIWPVQKPKDL